MANKTFPDGLMFKLPPEKAPEYVKGKISVKIEPFIKWLQEHKSGDWINFDLKVSKEGKSYVELDTWKPEKKEPEVDITDGSDLPF